MKRKRGHKKGKSKKLPTEGASTTVASPNDEVLSANTDENSSSEEETDKPEPKLEPEPKPKPKPETVKAETPPEQPEKMANVRADGVIERRPPTAVYGRVKVKLKTLKPPLESQIPLPEAPSQSDTDKSSQQIAVDKKQVEFTEKKMEESGNSVSDSKKNGSIMIVSSKGLNPTSAKESSISGLSPEKKVEEQVPKLPSRDSRYNRKELEASLEVVKKIMKMDAAEPFNKPVNPIELGIPDYFDVIDTPMDFGTICSNLESGTKYMDSEDVYKDVQYIWNNCFKYNNKGDYIVDLMKRVKKNFMKYWAAAGLCTERSRKNIGGENIHMDEGATSGHGKKHKKGKGFKRHKDDCMCAICIMKRRRKEREAREAQELCETGAQPASPQIKVTETGLPREHKREENPNAESPCGEDTSSYLETSPDQDADVEMEDEEETRHEAVVTPYDDDKNTEGDRVEFRDKFDRSKDISEKSLQSDKGENERYSHVEQKVQDESGSRIKTHKEPLVQLEAQTEGPLQQRHELLELEKKRQRLRLLETFRDLENPMLLGLCGAFFPSNRQTVWNGANSLVKCQRSCRRSDIHEAVASFMNPS